VALQAWTKVFWVLFRFQCLGFSTPHTCIHTWGMHPPSHLTQHKRPPLAPFPSGHSDNSTVKKGNRVSEVQILTHTHTHTHTDSSTAKEGNAISEVQMLTEQMAAAGIIRSKPFEAKKQD
jgi:hypothetical protein